MAAYRPKCFISYAPVDVDFVYDNIRYIVKELGIDIWDEGERILPGATISESIVYGIKQSDIVIFFLDRRSSLINFEVGVALGNNKPVLAIIDEYKYDVPSNLRHLNYLAYRGDNLNIFRERLRISINNILETVIDKAVFADNTDTKIIGISVGSDRDDFAGQLAFTSAFIGFIKYITDKPQIRLIQTSKGSLKSLISLDLKSWAELVE